jgi:hypothetical protein
MKRHAVTIGAAALGAAATAAVLLPSRKIGPEPHLPPPQHLSATVRGLLDKRMARHASDMSELEKAVVLLDQARAAQLAERIASEPMLSRPTEPSQLNAELPERFFVLQDALRADAARLAAAARAGDFEQLSKMYSQVTQTCVTCHAAYLHDQPPPH